MLWNVPKIKSWNVLATSAGRLRNEFTQSTTTPSYFDRLVKDLLDSTKLALNCSKPTIETLMQGVRCVQTLETTNSEDPINT